jgi:hypothetical protein
VILTVPPPSVVPLDGIIAVIEGVEEETVHEIAYALGTPTKAVVINTIANNLESKLIIEYLILFSWFTFVDMILTPVKH